MPLGAFFSAALETSINQTLLSQPETAQRLHKLAGKRLVVFLDVLPQGLTFVFSNKVDVLIGPATFEEAKTNVDSDTCIIRTQVSSLDKMKDASQLTNLIQNNALSLVGDINIAQSVSEMAKSVNIDIEDWLAKHTTDVFAHSVVSIAKKTHSTVLQKLALLSGQMSDVVLEEKPIAARKQAIASFCSDVSALRNDTARVEARLQRLEKRCE